MAEIGELFLSFNTDTNSLEDVLNSRASGIGKGFGALFSQGFSMGAGMAVFNKLADVAGKVWDYFTDGAQEAYQVQLEAETKIETVMRQRMKSTDEEIQKIKDLASEIQGLGVIGDEVSLSGAQQLATFLNSEEALKTLMPAMDNLLAQQRGLNATASDAISIGNMMGKVMQGQTSALTRAGITFTEAQEQVLKYGNEQERAAMLAQVITDNVGNMNAALAGTDLGRQQQLSNTLGDIKEKFGQVYTDLKSLFLPILQKFADFMDNIANKLIDLTSQLKEFAQSMGWIEFNELENNADVASNYISDSFTSAADKANEALQGVGLASFDTIIKLTGGASDESDAADESGISETPMANAAQNESKKITDDTEKKANIFTKAWEKVSPVFGRIYEAASPYLERLWNLVGKVKKVIQEWWTENGESFLATLKTIWGYITEIGGYIIDKIVSALERWLPGFVEGVLNFVKGFAEFVEKWWPYIEPAAKALVDVFFVLVDIVAFVVNAILNEFWPAVDLIIEGISLGIYAIVMVIYGLVSTIMDCIGWIFKTVVEVGIGIWNAVDSLVTFILDICIGLWQAIDTGISGALDAIINFFGGLIDGAKNAITSVGDFFGGLWDKITGFFSDLGSTLKNFWNDFIEFAKSPINGVIGFINKVIDGINSIKLKAPDWLGGKEIGFNIKHVPQLAEGGIAKAKNGGQLVNVAEAGQDEAIIPLNKLWAGFDKIRGLISTVIDNQREMLKVLNSKDNIVNNVDNGVSNVMNNITNNTSTAINNITRMPEVKSAGVETKQTSSEIDERLVDRIVAKLAAAIDPTLTIETLEVKLGNDAVVDKVINSINRKTKLKGRSVIINT